MRTTQRTGRRSSAALPTAIGPATCCPTDCARPAPASGCATRLSCSSCCCPSSTPRRRSCQATALQRCPSAPIARAQAGGALRRGERARLVRALIGCGRAKEAAIEAAGEHLDALRSTIEEMRLNPLAGGDFSARLDGIIAERPGALRRAVPHLAGHRRARIAARSSREALAARAGELLEGQLVFLCEDALTTFRGELAAPRRIGLLQAERPSPDLQGACQDGARGEAVCAAVIAERRSCTRRHGGADARLRAPAQGNGRGGGLCTRTKRRTCRPASRMSRRLRGGNSSCTGDRDGPQRGASIPPPAPAGAAARSPPTSARCRARLSSDRSDFGRPPHLARRCRHGCVPALRLTLKVLCGMSRAARIVKDASPRRETETETRPCCYKNNTPEARGRTPKRAALDLSAGGRARGARGAAPARGVGRVFLQPVVRSAHHDRDPCRRACRQNPALAAALSPSLSLASEPGTQTRPGA